MPYSPITPFPLWSISSLAGNLLSSSASLCQQKTPFFDFDTADKMQLQNYFSFLREHHFIEDMKEYNHCYKTALTRSALLVHLNTFALICGSTVIQLLQNNLFCSLKWWRNVLYINNIMNCLLWVLHPWLKTAHRHEGSWHWEDMWARAVLASLPNQVYVMSYYSWSYDNCFNISLL